MDPLCTPLRQVLLAHPGHGWHDGWWFGPLIPLLWIALIGLTVWLITRRRRCSSATGRARGILAERYARGELTIDEYRDRLASLG